MAERPGEQEQEAYQQDRQDHRAGRAAEHGPRFRTSADHGGREPRQLGNHYQQAWRALRGAGRGTPAPHRSRTLPIAPVGLHPSLMDSLDLIADCQI